jgi:hypothetical protein
MHERDEVIIERLAIALSEAADRFLAGVTTDDAVMVRRSAFMRLLGRALGAMRDLPDDVLENAAIQIAAGLAVEARQRRERQPEGTRH